MSQAVKISAVIITLNEERNIGRCLESLKNVADEIVVVDSFSTDKTADICETYGVRFIQHLFEGHIEQKNYAVSQAEFDCVLSLDADEALSEELARSILNATGNWSWDGYRFNRLTHYCGKWIRHSGWYPDAKLRLWDRRKGRWGGVNPHDHVVMDAGSRIRHLGGDLLHYSYHSIADHIAQINRFSEIAARAAFSQGRKANIFGDILLNPFLTFFKKYIVKLGILDGYEGFVISIHTAYGKFLKYAKLNELNKRR
jgi:glycosyltransferase involved in cell wall biosynthesis